MKMISDVGRKFEPSNLLIMCNQLALALFYNEIVVQMGENELENYQKATDLLKLAKKKISDFQ